MCSTFRNTRGSDEGTCRVLRAGDTSLGSLFRLIESAFAKTTGGCPSRCIARRPTGTFRTECNRETPWLRVPRSRRTSCLSLGSFRTVVTGRALWRIKCPSVRTVIPRRTGDTMISLCVRLRLASRTRSLICTSCRTVVSFVA